MNGERGTMAIDGDRRAGKREVRRRCLIAMVVIGRAATAGAQKVSVSQGYIPTSAKTQDYDWSRQCACLC